MNSLEPKKFRNAAILLLLLSACGGGKGGSNPGDNGGDGGNVAGNSAAGSSGAGGKKILPDETGAGGGAGDASGGTGGTTQTGGSTQTGGTSQTGGNSQTGGKAQTGGTSQTGDKSKEHLWYNNAVDVSGHKTISDSQPSNWLAPINYFGGKLAVRLNVTQAPNEKFGLEFCLYKSGPNDAKHTCGNIISSVSGTGEHKRLHVRTSGIMINVLAQGLVTEDDFKTPWATNVLRLIKDHATELPGPLKGHLTVVLVPAGSEFSGWENYPIQ